MGKSWRQWVDWFFAPPYYGVPWLVWLYVIGAVACYPDGGVFAGYLTGYDDPVRMTQVLDWINGAGWYDRRIMRVDPPDGFQTIWSRIVDIPIALVVLIAQQCVAQKQAALIAALVVPLIELRIMFAAAAYFVRPLVGRNRARLISLFLVFSTISNYRNFSVSGFYPGEASHHPWYLILVTFLLGAAGRMVAGVTGPAPARIMALAIGLLLAVGIEPFPLLAGICALLILIAWHYQRPGLAWQAAQGFAGGGLLGLLFLPLHQPPQNLLTVSFIEPSILGPILIGAAALMLGIAYHAIRHARRYAGLGGIGLAAFALGLSLLLAFPQMREGAAAGLSPAERALVHHEHLEAMPLYHAGTDPYDLCSLYLPLLLALGAGIYCIRRARTPRRQAVAWLYLGFGVLGSGMAEWLARYYHQAVTIACGWLLWLWRAALRRLPQNGYYSLAALGLFAALAPFTMLLLPALGRNAPILSQVVLFPATLQTVQEPCGLVNFGKYLNARYGKDTNLLVPGVDSSRMLFATDLTIDFLNNYPSQNRFIDNETFFGTQLPEVARNIALRHKVDLVAICRIAMKPIPLKPGEAPMMFERLEAGQPPRWLKPVDLNLRGLYQLYRVDQQEVREADRP